MSLIAELIGKVRQRDPAIVTDGEDGQMRFTRAGQLYVSDWKAELAMAGHVYSLSPIAAAIAGGDETTPQVTGGGAGTVIDSDQPEILIGVDAGYFLVPLEIYHSAKIDTDADLEVGAFLAFTDRTQAPPTSATATVLAPNNHLQGGPVFPGRSYHTVTADLTDPVLSDLLVYETVVASDFVNNGTSTNQHTVSVQRINVNWQCGVPMFIKGPCSLVACWGGTAAVTALTRLTFACIPERRIIN